LNALKLRFTISNRRKKESIKERKEKRERSCKALWLRQFTHRFANIC